MEDPKIEAVPRKRLGSIGARNLRREGRIPGTLYGHKEDPVSFSISEDSLKPVVQAGHHVVDLEFEGKSEKAIIHDVQWHVFADQILHCDLLRVRADEKVTVDVALHVKGTSQGVLNGGILEQPHHQVPVECLALRIPDEIVVRINDLKINEAIHVSDVEWPEGVKCMLPEGELLIQVAEPNLKEEDMDTEDVGAEPELIGGDKDKDKEEEGDKE